MDKQTSSNSSSKGNGDQPKVRRADFKRQSFLRAFLGTFLSWRIFTSALALIFRLASGGIVARPVGKRPVQPLQVYEYEGCPYCRKVREALTTLDLEAVILPCPKGGKRFRDEAKRLGGKEQFPFLVDPNGDVKMYESDAIVKYLFKTYGNNKVPFLLSNPLVNFSSFLASAVRFFAGVRKQKTNENVAPAGLTDIELYSFECSPYSRLVRETLTELELPYLLHNVGKRSPSRGQFVERSGKMMVPYLVDKNKKVKGTPGMFESSNIIDYLRDSYGESKKKRE